MLPVHSEPSPQEGEKNQINVTNRDVQRPVISSEDVELELISQANNQNPEAIQETVVN